MNLDYLDKIIPKRWILLLFYWLPFFKNPSNFYFECRAFIDELVQLDEAYFWKKFPDLISIFERTTYTQTERKLSLQIISKIFAKEKAITAPYLVLFLTKFNPDVKRRTPILNDVLERIPNNIYSDYFNGLNAANCSLNDLKWCVNLKTKFKLEDRLKFILSLPDKNFVDYQPTVFKLLTQELEAILLNPQLTSTQALSAYATEQLLESIFIHKRFMFSDAFIQVLINELLQKNDPLLATYILDLNIAERFIFFENFLINSENFQQTSQHFLNLCKEDQWSDMVDYLIDSVSSIQEAENEYRWEKKITTNNWNSFLLAQLLEGAYAVNLFQFLAIQTLTKKQLNLESLKKIFNTNHSLQHYKHFSIFCQLSVIESSIKEIKKYIKDHYMIHVHKENTRQDIHRAFYQFYNNEYTGKPLNVAKLILKKLPNDLQIVHEADLNFLQELLSQLYVIFDDQKLTDYKNKCLIIRNKHLSDEQDRNEARIELTHRIFHGQQTSVSYQRMQEVFGSQAPVIQENWKKLAIGINFFDATDPVEYKAAEKEAEDAKEAIKFNREYNDYSCLSSSPSSINYFYAH